MGIQLCMANQVSKCIIKSPSFISQHQQQPEICVVSFFLFFFFDFSRLIFLNEFILFLFVCLILFYLFV